MTEYIPLNKKNLDKKLYSLPELLALTGISRKQATYWAKTKLLNPLKREMSQRSGQPAYFYSAKEAIKALIISELKRAGFSLRQIQQVTHNLEEHGIRLDEAKNYLLTDGVSVYYAYSETEVVDIFRHHRQMLLLVSVHEHVEKLRKVA